MKRLDESVNQLSLDGLKEGLFQGSWDPVTLEASDSNIHLLFSQKLSSLPIYKKRICLINPHQIEPEKAISETVDNKRYQDYPPTGLLYLASVINSFHPLWDVEIVDLHLETLERTSKRTNPTFKETMEIIPSDCDAYGVSMMFEAWEPMVVRVLEWLKKERKGLFFAGGVHASVTSRRLLKKNLCEFVIKKEGEAQIVKFLNRWESVHDTYLEESEQFQEMFNLDFTLEGKIFSFREKFENPIAADIRKQYDLIDLDRYNLYGAPTIWTRMPQIPRERMHGETLPGNKKWATMIASRGCRGKCTFCQVSYIMGQGVRTRSAQDIVDEIFYLYSEKDVRHIEFVDDDFLGNRDRTIQWLKLLADLNIDLTFSIGSGVLAIKIDEETAQVMDDAGCIMTGFGVESGNEERLKLLKKPTNLDKVSEGTKIFKKNHRHIWLQVNFMMGFPNETYGEMMDTFNFAKSLEVDFCQSSILRPILGTPIYDELSAINDERIKVLDNFGGAKRTADTAGKDIVSRGHSFDDVFGDVIDFREVDMNDIPDGVATQQFQIYFNAMTNLIGSPNLRSGGLPEKTKCFTNDILKAYPMDAVSWGANAKASLLLGHEQDYRESLNNCRKAVDNSRYWSEYFDLYDVPNLLGLPL